MSIRERWNSWAQTKNAQREKIKEEVKQEDNNNSTKLEKTKKGKKTKNDNSNGS